MERLAEKKNTTLQWDLPQWACGHVGMTPPFASAKVQPPTDRLSGAGAAQDMGRGLLGPGDKVADVTLAVTSPGVVSEGHHTE